MRIDKNGKEITKTMSYGLQFIDITRFMASSLSNLPEGIHKVKCISSNKCYHDFTNVQENLKKEFVNTNKLANEDVNKFILLLRKDIYLYEYIDDWETFNEA